MLREPFWTPYERHRELVDRQDRVLDVGHDSRLALEAETYFAWEGVMDCA
jgi:hypothetical protein